MKAASISWRLALTALLLISACQVWQLRRAPDWIAAQVEREGRVTRTAALAAIAATREELSLRVDRLIDVAQKSVADMAARSDARIQDTIQEHARLTDANSTRIFALCSALQLRRKLHLASESELDFALNCTDIEPSHHPGLPNWLTEQWDGLLDKLTMDRR